MSIIEIKNLTKQFPNTLALDDVSLTFEENKIYGLLGRNGAGKTTLLNLITNKLFPTSGKILVDGESVIENDNALSKIYCMSEKELYPESMRLRDVFKWSCDFYPHFDINFSATLADKFSLKLSKKVKELSTGYSTLFKLIIALSCNAPIVMLDEPVLGLDANNRDLFYKELLSNFIEHPKTYIISTHLIEEVADIIGEVIIIENGRILANEPVGNLLQKGYTVSGKAADIENFVTGKNVLGVDTLGGLKTAYILGQIDKEGIPDGIDVSKLSLQKLFIELTNSNGGARK